jgi:competence protein ComEC
MAKQGEKVLTPARVNRIMFIAVFALLAFFLIYMQLNAPEDEPDESMAGEEVLVHFIDVGQGDCTLIQSRDNAVLIDGGEYSARNVIIEYLESMGVTTLDYVVATHPDSDHIGSLAAVIDRFGVKNVWMPDVMHTTATFERLLDAIERKGLTFTPIKAGAHLDAGLIQMTAVAPNSDSYKDTNEYSIVLRMVYGRTVFLFTGDAETASENEILAEGWEISADVIKVGHHGSRSSSSEPFLDAVGPRIAVISCKTGNSYGHPHAEVLERYAARNVAVYRTDELGTVVLTTDGEQIYLVTDEE